MDALVKEGKDYAVYPKLVQTNAECKLELKRKENKESSLSPFHHVRTQQKNSCL